MRYFIKSCLLMSKTKRSLYMRVREHKTDKTSVIAQHQNSKNHKFDFKNIYMVDQQSRWAKRKVSESISMCLQIPTINLKENTKKILIM